mmetsp:Transcript_57302/g.170868  ORF Transcript_57302/g.170868 Transcript_57302/m.170868 type:complete len:182 (-) Transcript_57302:224-769(-)
MIKASVTPEVPWGFICGFPIRHGGDLYGGAMYLQSSTVEGRAATPQGRAIRDASYRFGNGETLPFPPCKRGYIPLVNGKRMYGCHIHSDDRTKRVRMNGGKFRLGEKPLTDFWLVSERNLGSNEILCSKSASEPSENLANQSKSIDALSEQSQTRDATSKRRKVSNSLVNRSAFEKQKSNC